MFSEKRAITPVIATLLLIAITVAAVAGFYIFYNNFIRQQNVGSRQPSVVILGPSTGSTGDAVTVSIKNTGNVDIPSITVRHNTAALGTWTTALSFPAVNATSPLRPNQVITATGTLNAPSTSAPPRWEVQVTASTAGGSSVMDVLVIKRE